MTMLIVHNNADLEKWESRTRANIAHRNQNIEDEDQKQAIIDREFKDAQEAHKARMWHPGVVPSSAKFLDLEDPDGN